MRKHFCYSSLVALILFSSNFTVNGQDRSSGRTFVTRSEVIAQHGMACTSQPLATQAALDILKQGGNAIDAAIAGNAVLGVTEPHVNGIGGDIFAIIYEAKTGKLHGLNGSGHSPYSLTLAEFKKRNLKYIPAKGPLPVSVPGCVDGWFAMHKRFGKLGMDKILAPAISYAKNGYPVADEASGSLSAIKRAYGEYPNVVDVYNPDGKVPKRGDVLKNPQLANTLDQIAKGGRDAFYTGDIARKIDAFMKKNGGFLSYKDLADHHSDWVEPVSTNYRGYDVWELPPNGQGIAVLQMLNILEGYDFSKIAWGSPEHVHLFVEAKKLVFEDRAKYYADPAFAKIPVKELISKKYAAERRKLIDPNRASTKHEAGNPILEDGDTIYMTVADSEGNMVSLIQSNFQGYGSGMVPDGLGFMLQDRGQLFTLEEGQNNTYAPHKRPFHTIIPAFVTKEGKPYMSFGVMGGGFQPLGHTEIIMNMIDFGMNGQEAGDAPRIDHQGSSEPTGEKKEDYLSKVEQEAGMGASGEIFLESGFPYETIRELMRKGHKVGYQRPGYYGGYQSIRFDPVQKVYFGASESRKDGMAAGW